MDRNKAHGYYTRRNKAAVMEENNENVNLMSPAMSKRKLIDSPSGNKLCILSGYASPPCRPVTLSQTNENEIEWDLTSPSARKYHGLLSDKKTSTPTQTPTRKRELRPRVALCKKNIALAVERSGDLINELAALNDLVNSEQAQNVMTPPRLLKMSTRPDSPASNKKKSPKPNDQSTSEVFDDDSFFSDSLLLCTQAIEQEALGEPQKNEKASNHTISNSSSPGLSVSRKSFELDFMDSEALEPSITKGAKIMEPKLAVKHPTPVKSSTTNRVTSACKSLSNSSPVKIRSFPNNNSKPVVKCVNNYTSKDSTVFTKPPPPPKSISQVSLTRVSSNQSSKSFKSPPQLLKSGASLGIVRLQDPPTSNTQKSFASTNVPLLNALPVVAPSSKNTRCNQSNDLFDDDDDDLLIAVANEVESQYVSSTYKKATTNDDDDDGFFQPEVLDFISQIETQAISTQKSTAELLEEKRQAAIQRRQQRLKRH